MKLPITIIALHYDHRDDNPVVVRVTRKQGIKEKVHKYSTNITKHTLHRLSELSYDNKYRVTFSTDYGFISVILKPNKVGDHG